MINPTYSQNNFSGSVSYNKNTNTNTNNNTNNQESVVKSSAKETTTVENRDARISRISQEIASGSYKLKSSQEIASSLVDKEFS